ncbi:MerR family transcriptional regulator [Paenibacillus sepulcri]|uniref:Chromosome-anchoring protein RacA n=1 Tax=Paenibacillus sepulcri TaxID=359917 RepID=A0ABS7C7B2_9BACL|nr:MerR family transcriptional regulator [Paenibacillus sepulcri]
MDVLKTKDAAAALGVSQTTVKRWVSMFPAHFIKDRFGHYIFTDQDISRLRYMKERIDQGESLDQLELESAACKEAVEPESVMDSAAGYSDEVLLRIQQVEHLLSQKADDVVSMQVLQHRKELEDLNRIVNQLMESVQQLENKWTRSRPLDKEIHLPDLQSHRKKRSLLRSLFQLW